MSGGPEIALNRSPLVTCLSRRRRHRGMAQRLSIGSDRASSDRENIDVPFPVPLPGADKKSIKCYASVGRRLYPRYLIDLIEICHQRSGSTQRNNERR